MSAGTSDLRYTAAVDKRFKSPGPQPNGIQAAEAGLWCIDQVDLKVYLLDWDTGATLQEIQTATEHSSGITLDGDGNLWITSTFQLDVVKIDPRTGMELARYPDPGAGLAAQAEQVDPNGKRTGSHGIEWRAGGIYLAAPPTQRLHVMDAATWEPVAGVSGAGPSSRTAWGGTATAGCGWRTPPREPCTPWTRRRGASTTCSASPNRTRCTA